MTVYVDDMYLYEMGHFRRGGRVYKMSHMVADTLEELHAMADTIGVDRRWFQDPETMRKVSHPHYDITMSKRALAVKAGAKEITIRELSAMRHNRRGELVPPPGDHPGSPA
jgi:hypothetical protein